MERIAERAHGPTSWSQMTAGALREAAVLVLVFGLLDKYIFYGGPSFAWTVVIVSVALAFFAVGGVLGRRWI